MRDWGDVFSTAAKSGIYTMERGERTGAIKKAARQAKLDFSIADLKGIIDKEGLLRKIAAALGFPEYFGANWDALNDCLTDMSWKPAAGYVIILKNFTAFTGRQPQDAEVAKDVFASAAGYWKEKAGPFYIILS